MSDNQASRVLLVRHGRTALNAEGRLRGLANPELDPVGVAQAQATAAALKPVGIGRVISSPLRRAVHTATLIAEASGVSHDVEPAFNDRDYGPWTGHLTADVVREWGSVDEAPDVEKQTVVLARALRALNALVDSDSDAAVAVVTHDAVIRPILVSIQPDISPKVETGSWAELVHTSDGWTIVSFDNVPS